MSCITRSLFRWGLISGLALGGAMLVSSTIRGHVYNGVAHARSAAQSLVDEHSSDPVVLRRQLKELAEQYPDRIAEVRGEVAAVEHQLAQYNKDTEIARRVVVMATEDLSKLKTLVTRAEAEAQSTARPVAIRFEGVRFDVDEALTEARRINNVRATYQDRLAQDKQQMTFLQEQKSRLAAILEQLETEYTAFQTQLWQLDRQIDAIERNERLIQLTEEQQATLEEYEKLGKVGSLKQLEGKLAQLRAVQEAQLKTLEKRGLHHDYEGRAKSEIDLGDQPQLDDPFANINEASEYEISDDDDDRDTSASSRSMVWSGPLVIE